MGIGMMMIDEDGDNYQDPLFVEVLHQTGAVHKKPVRAVSSSKLSPSLFTLDRNQSQMLYFVFPFCILHFTILPFDEISLKRCILYFHFAFYI